MVSGAAPVPSVHPKMRLAEPLPLLPQAGPRTRLIEQLAKLVVL
jgi:hypothetical protein